MTITSHLLQLFSIFHHYHYRLHLVLPILSVLLITNPNLPSHALAQPSASSPLKAVPTPNMEQVDPSDLNGSAFVGPVTNTPSPGRVLRGFEKPDKNWLPGHRGVDLAATLGDPIFAASTGTVLFVGTIAGTPVVSIEHPGGLRTTYQPVFATVHTGDQVAIGDRIGTLAPNKTGEAGLHWGAKYGADDYINPLSLLPRPEIRLKAVTD